MSVTLLRNYQAYAAGAVVTLPDSTEASLIAQGLATAFGTTSMPSLQGQGQTYATIGGNIALAAQAGQTVPTYLQGPSRLPVIPMGGVALTGFETNGVAPVAGSINLTEINVPYWNTWTGVGVLNGTTVGTDNFIVAVYGSNGALLANSALAGTL